MEARLGERAQKRIEPIEERAIGQRFDRFTKICPISVASSDKNGFCLVDLHDAASC